MTITYHSPKPNHAHLLEIFFQESLQLNFSYLPKEAHFHFQAPWKIDKLIPRLENPSGLLICAWENDQIIGLVYGTGPEGGVGTIIWLMVHPDYQNQHIGKELLSQAKSHYKNQNAHKIKLTVHDERAMKFYERENFIKEALHKKHWWELDFWALSYFIR